MALVLGLPLRPAAADVGIVLKPQVEVGPAEVTLADVATVSAEDPALLRRLKALPLGRAPRSGEPTVLGRGILARWIRVRTGLEPNRIAWSGAESAQVRMAVHPVSGEELVRVAQAAVQAAFSEQGLRADVHLVQPPPDLRAPAGRLELKPRPLAAPRTVQAPVPGPASSPIPTLASGKDRRPLLARRQTLWVDLSVDGQFLRTVTVDFDVDAYAPAYVATGDMAAGQQLDPAKVAVKEALWTGQDPLPVSEPGPAGPGGAPAVPAVKLRRPLKAGEVVTRGHVEAMPLVVRGEFATLRTVQGPIQLESRAEVLQDGFLGQVVRVKLPNATSSIQAHVVGQGLVEVRP